MRLPENYVPAICSQLCCQCLSCVDTQFNTAAIRLYRRAGFEEIPLSGTKFKRANIKMQINL